MPQQGAAAPTSRKTDKNRSRREFNWWESTGHAKENGQGRTSDEIREQKLRKGM